MKSNVWLRVWACMLVCLVSFGAISVPIGAQAQRTTHTGVVHKKNFAQRHPTMTGIAAGVAAYKVAKKTGHNRAMAGRKKNFAQRHPVMTGIAAGMVVHKVAKDSGKNKR